MTADSSCAWMLGMVLGMMVLMFVTMLVADHFGREK